MIRINVVITVKPENRERLLRLLGEMGDLSRRENGCAGYEVLENVRSRTELMIVETWTDDEVLAAHKAADREDYQGTDDASLVERMGGKVRVVESTRDNIKVTLPEDLALAEAALERRLLT